MTRLVCGLVSVYLYELKEFVIYPFYGLKFHPSGMIRPACGLCILTVHFYGLEKFSPALDDPSSLWTLFIIHPLLWTLNFTSLG